MELTQEEKELLIAMELTQEEKELLIAADKSGLFRLITTPETGNYVMAGKKPFTNNNDPGYANAYLEAFESLRNRGYIRHEKNEHYRLTASGKKARKLLEKEQVVNS